MSTPQSIQGETARRPTRSGAQRVTDSQFQEMMDKGMTQAEMTRHINEELFVSISRQAVHQRVKKLMEDRGEHLQRILPWRMRVEHKSGWVYNAALAYTKMRRGDGMTSRELTEARELEAHLHKLNAVLTYNRDKGFVLRNRRPDDGPGALAEK